MGLGFWEDEGWVRDGSEADGFDKVILEENLAKC